MNKKIVISIAIVVLAVVCATMLVACVPSNADKAKEKMEEAGYTVVMTKSENSDSDVSAVLVCTKGGVLDVAQGNVQIVTATYYSSSKAAKEAYNDAKAKAEENGKSYECKRSGKCIYYGTEQAMKDFN